MPKTSSQDWFYHSPHSYNTKAIKEAPPASQVPGLGDHAPFTEEDFNKDPAIRRKWIRESDSDYVKLAKAGGRKDLFQYQEHKTSDKGPKPYPRVDWFDHLDPNDEDYVTNKSIPRSTMPSWYIHDEVTCGKEDFVPTKRPRPLLGFDELSVWKREAEDGKKKESMLPAINNKTKLDTKKSMKTLESRLPPIPRRPGEGDMSHLLAMGYQSDWLQEQKDRRQREKDAKVEERKRFDEKLERDHEFIERKKRKDVIPEVKPLFKMSKFNSISSKVDSFRT